MAKTNQVTNDAERDEMQSRIIKASVLIADPLLDPDEKARYMKAYDEMVSIMKAYDRAQYCITYPGVRAIYEQLGWVVADVKTEQRDTSAHEVTENNEVDVKGNAESHDQPAEVKDEYVDPPDWL